MIDIAVYSAICEEDSWLIDQYLAEMYRLDLRFGMYFDRCSDWTKRKVESHPFCVGVAYQDDPTIEYHEMAKQRIFNLMSAISSKWLIQLDVDEIFERRAPEKLEEIRSRNEDYLQIRWLSCWNDLNHIRVDRDFLTHKRVKFYNVSNGRKWLFDHKITNGAKLLSRDGSIDTSGGILGKSDLVCLHTGMMTKEQRILHKARWDRIYTAAVGDNPYGFWRQCLDEEGYPPEIAENIYR